VSAAITENTNITSNSTAPSNLFNQREGEGDCSEKSQDKPDFQASMLQGVSRTFALTIPRLPLALREVVSNAYLLCRTVDTIEDEPGIPTQVKKELCDLFLEVLNEKRSAQDLSKLLLPLLSESSIPAEHQLIQSLDQVVAITRELDPAQRKSLIRCVKIMSEGMIYYQEHASADGLRDQPEMDKYCYHVAGVVGEMLTELFCHYSTGIAKNKQALFNLSVSFGQGLQMTNILKDIWDDHQRGACWLPRDLFLAKGLELHQMKSHVNNQDFQTCINELVGLAHGHLENALNYTLLIPVQEKGIREFCLWAIGMAMLTLRKIHATPGYINGQQVKISRNSVKATVMITGLTYRSNTLLRILFKQLGARLPKTS
jgi:farnesyl-diphosphate farnesyltransferase